MLKDNPVMVYREVMGPKTYLVLYGETEERVRTEAQRLIDAVVGHDPYGGTYVEKLRDGKWYTRLEYWTEKENG
jgi:hypothetical protein